MTAAVEGLPHHPTPEYWEAVAGLADRWRSATTVRAVTDLLPDAVHTSESGVTQLLADVRAAGVSLHPLWLASTVQYGRIHAAQSPVPVPDGYDRWLRRAALVEEAFRLQATWVRARFPGFPMFRVPHLVEGTAYATQEYSEELVWQRDHYLLRFQERADPPVADLGDEQLDLGDVTHAFVAQLRRTAEWAAFGEAQAQLEDTDRQQLRVVNDGLRQVLKPERLDAVNAVTSSRRTVYRQTQLDAALHQLSGRAAAYAAAFGALNSLVDQTFAGVLGNLVGYGQPRMLGDASDIELSGVDLSFTYPGALEVGSLRGLQTPETPDAVLITGATIADRDGAPAMRYRARVLSGSGRAFWSAPA